MNSYDMQERLTWSKGHVSETVGETIVSMLDGCMGVVETAEDMDRRGVDYIASLRRGSEVFIDLKVREAGCSRYWSNGTPELALETWSVVPEPDRGVRGKVGWTLDEGKMTHYTLHLFSPADTTECYLLPFQSLRVAFRRNFDLWRSIYRAAYQDSGSWRSQCLFVPAPVVIDAVAASMEGHVAMPWPEVITEDPAQLTQQSLFEWPAENPNT